LDTGDHHTFANCHLVGPSTCVLRLPSSGGPHDLEGISPHPPADFHLLWLLRFLGGSYMGAFSSLLLSPLKFKIRSSWQGSLFPEIHLLFYKPGGDLLLLSRNMRFNRLTDPHVPHGPRARQQKGYHRCLKLFAWGEGDSGGHVLRESTSRGLCGLVCPCFPWFLSFGNRTQNSRVAGVSPTTSPAGTRIWSPPRTAAGHRDRVFETETVFLQ
jgi:hypothetical protein